MLISSDFPADEQRHFLHAPLDDITPRPPASLMAAALFSILITLCQITPPHAYTPVYFAMHMPLRHLFSAAIDAPWLMLLADIAS